MGLHPGLKKYVQQIKWTRHSMFHYIRDKDRSQCGLPTQKISAAGVGCLVQHHVLVIQVGTQTMNIKIEYLP